MKSITLNRHILALILTILGISAAFGQVCSVDSQFANLGIYPSDTMPDMTAGSSYVEVRQFVLQKDTVIFGLTLPYDSAEVIAISNVPTGIGWECNANPVCTYLCHSQDFTRLCISFDGIPIDSSLGIGGYDSMMVTIRYFYQGIDFPGALEVNYPLYYRKDQSLAISSEMGVNFEWAIHPNPVVGITRIAYRLPFESEVQFSCFDAMGRLVANSKVHVLAAGSQQELMDLTALRSGIYFVVAKVDGSEMGFKKLIKID